MDLLFEHEAPGNYDFLFHDRNDEDVAFLACRRNGVYSPVNDNTPDVHRFTNDRHVYVFDMGFHMFADLNFARGNRVLRDNKALRDNRAYLLFAGAQLGCPYGQVEGFISVFNLLAIHWDFTPVRKSH
jgi:hypothetical protein